MFLLRAPSVLKHTREVRLSDIDTISFLDFRVEDNEGKDFIGLIASVRKHGLLQPVVVRPPISAGGNNSSRRRFELVCGRRRYAACRRLGFDSIPCVVMNLDDREAFEVALVENVQKRTLDPIEEAEAFKSYVMNYGRGSVTRLAERICKSEEYVSHRLLLLGLPKPLLDRISRRLLNPSHAMELVWLKDEKKQLKLSEVIRKHNLSLRDLRSVLRTLKVDDTTVSEAVEKALHRRQVEKDGKVDSKRANTSSEPWEDYSQPQNRNSDSDLRILDRAILVVRAALTGVDFLIQDAVSSPGLRALLMEKRRTIHATLDELLKTKISYRRNGAILPVSA